jgi:hypothetical protein
MDPVSVRMVRAALGWLMLGVLLGALLLVDRQAPGSWRRWFSPTHGHILVVGWFLPVRGRDCLLAPATPALRTRSSGLQ